jgi:hypothetical protein
MGNYHYSAAMVITGSLEIDDALTATFFLRTRRGESAGSWEKAARI